METKNPGRRTHHMSAKPTKTKEAEKSRRTRESDEEIHIPDTLERQIEKFTDEEEKKRTTLTWEQTTKQKTTMSKTGCKSE